MSAEVSNFAQVDIPAQAVQDESMSELHVTCPRCRADFSPSPAVLKHLAYAVLANSRRTRAPGARPKYDIPCAWCKEHFGVNELRNHWRACPQRPAEDTLIPCAWCRTKLSELRARAHIAVCPRMPKAEREKRAAWDARRIAKAKASRRTAAAHN